MDCIIIGFVGIGSAATFFIMTAVRWAQHKPVRRLVKGLLASICIAAAAYAVNFYRLAVITAP